MQSQILRTASCGGFYSKNHFHFIIDPMRKFYLLLLATLLGGAIANAQSPLEGYEAPTYPTVGNVGNIVSFSTSGALEDLNNVSIPKEPGGKIAQELLVAPGSKVDLTINIDTWWGQFVTFCDANETKEMTRLILCGNSGNGGFENHTTGVTVYVEDGATKVSEGTLPSFTVHGSCFGRRGYRLSATYDVHRWNRQRHHL